MRDAVVAKSPNFMNPGLSSVRTSDELKSFSIFTTRVRRLIDGSNWLPPSDLIGEGTGARMSRTSPEQKIDPKVIFKLGRKIKILSRKIIL